MKVLNVNASKFKNRVGQLLTLVLAISFTAITASVQAQTPFKVASGSLIKVIGTSNIHDWTMSASAFSCDGNFTVKGDQLVDITALNFSLPVANLKGKEDLLTTRAHKALKWFGSTSKGILELLAICLLTLEWNSPSKKPYCL